jgi:MFS transporter, DHA2 family, multidrug resistance protein
MTADSQRLTAPAENHSRPWRLIGVLVVGSISTMLAATIVNVALPAIIGAFGLGQDQAQWLSTAFLTSSTGFMLLNTWMVASFGMRQTFIMAMGLFIAGSFAGATSSGLEMLVLGRMLQGAGAGLIQPMAMVIIFTRFPQHARGLAIGLYSAGVIVSPAFGPVIGGALVDAFDWRVVFVATAPLALLAVPLAAACLPSREASGARPKLDWQGLALVLAALALFLQSLTHGHREGWDDGGASFRLTGAVACAATFLLWEARHPFPILNLRLFADRGFSLSALVILLTGVAIYGSTYLIPLFVQLIQHYSPTSAGLVMAPAGLAMAIGFPLAGRLSDRIDARILLAAGVAMFGASMLLLSGVSTFVSFLAMASWIALSRFGIAVLMPAANASAMRQVDPSMLAFAAPAATFLTQTGGALGVAGLSVLLQERAAFHAAVLTPLIREANPQAMEAMALLKEGFVEAGAPLSTAALGAERQLASSIWLGAQVLAFRDCFVLIAWAFAALVLTIPFIPKGRTPQKVRKIEPAQPDIDRISSIS